MNGSLRKEEVRTADTPRGQPPAATRIAPSTGELLHRAGPGPPPDTENRAGAKLPRTHSNPWPSTAHALSRDASPPICCDRRHRTKGWLRCWRHSPTRVGAPGARGSGCTRRAMNDASNDAAQPGHERSAFGKNDTGESSHSRGYNPLRSKHPLQALPRRGRHTDRRYCQR